MTQARSILSDLEAVIASGSSERRNDILRGITDLLEATGTAAGHEYASIFDNILLRLAATIEPHARTELAIRLAVVLQAPPKILDLLSRDIDIGIAGPILSQSASLTLSTLVACAKSQGQDHLMAISRRQIISEPVTDILVERGNTAVLTSTASNTGARYSDFGFSTLVGRSGEGDDLALAIANRADLPRYLLVRLISKISDSVKAQLEGPTAERLGKCTGNRMSPQRMNDARNQNSRFDYTQAIRSIQRLSDTGALTEMQLLRFLSDDAIPLVIAALSCMARVSIPVVESALRQARPEPLMLIAKSIGLTWPALKSIMLLRTEFASAEQKEQDAVLLNYERLRQETAKSIIELRYNGSSI